MPHKHAAIWAACMNARFAAQQSYLAQVETIFLGGKRISIRTSKLEEKATACNMLCCYADELKEGFFPYVEQVRTCSTLHSVLDCLSLSI